MYLYFGFVEETASTITFATELADNPCGTLYKYFLYASENLRLFLSKSQSLVKIILVSIKLGLILITRMLVFSNSILRASDIASNANFVAEYAPIMEAIPILILSSFTILPLLFFSINGRTFFVNPIRPKKFVSNWLLRSSNVISSIAPGST